MKPVLAILLWGSACACVAGMTYPLVDLYFGELPAIGWVSVLTVAGMVGCVLSEANHDSSDH